MDSDAASTLEPRRPTWAEIDLRALQQNYQILKDWLSHGTSLMAVVKANAYGHGSVACASALEAIGADWLGVALPEEAFELRAGGITRPIFCLGGFWKGQSARIVAEGITPAAFRLDAIEELDVAGRAAGRIVDYHLKIDTGMGRLGLPFGEVAELAPRLAEFRHARLTGLLTHFAEADGVDRSFTELQIARFNQVARQLEEAGFRLEWCHLANSAGIHAHPTSHGTLARAGATLYGLTRDVLAPSPAAPLLSPVMSLHSRIVMLKRVPTGTPLGYGRSFVTTRESLIATLPIGYADGLRRAFSSNGEVLLRDAKAPIVGRVSMDLTIIDVTGIEGVEVGDEVVLLGTQGTNRITAEDLAAAIGTISYEIVTGIGPRVPRRDKF